MIDIDKIRNAVFNGRVRFRLHSAEMLIERNILKKQVYDAITHGEVIEEYITDKPFPSCLISYSCSNSPIHVVCSFNDIDDMAIIITVYVPDNDHFESDFKTRRKKNE